MARQNISARRFWEKRARDYFMPFDLDVFKNTSSVIHIMEKAGVKIRNAEILDVGAGTGIFALPLAAMGANVTALDISENMLKRLEVEAAAKKIPGVRTIRSSWRDFLPEDLGFDRRFDTVISSLSPVVDTEEDLLKMERCSKDSCVCIAACSVRIDAGREEIFKRLNIPLTTRPDMDFIRAKAEALGRKCFYETFPVEKSEDKNLSQLVDDAKKSLTANRLKCSESKIKETALQSFPNLRGDETIRCFWQSRRGVLIWEAGYH